MVKLTKYKSHKIYACPECWQPVKNPNIGKDGKGWWYCDRHGEARHATRYPTIFDSKAEYRAGQTIMNLKNEGKIIHLLHHETFCLLPERRFEDIRQWTRRELSYLDEIGLGNVKIPEPFRQYESDFTFIQDSVTKAVEIKGLTWKKSIRKKKNTAGDTWELSTKKPWPFFTREQPLSQFRMKAQLMKAFHKLDVEIWAGPLAFKFDEKWKLAEVPK